MAKLYIVGTPIGNFNDMTFRAVETLKKVDYIACEDTRHSLPLLKHFEIPNKELIAYHKFNEAECSLKIVSIIQEGKDVAIITDAGMPSISDPGAYVVSACHENGVDVEVIPGPTAFASAIALSGVKTNGFTFIGFLPEKQTEKKRVLQELKDSSYPFVLYVAPHDVMRLSSFLLEELGDREVYLARELTKIYECVNHMRLSNFSCEERGEMVLIVMPKEKEDYSTLSVEDHLKRLLNEGAEKKEAVKTVASLHNIPKNDVYQIAIQL